MNPRVRLRPEVLRRLHADAERRRIRQSQESPIRPEVSPIYPSSVYTFDDLDAIQAYYEHGHTSDAYVYRRNGHPNERPVEAYIAALEGAEAAVLCSSGMAAIAQTCFALLHPGDHVIATKHLYGGTYAFFEQTLCTWGVDISYVDLNDTLSLRKALRPETRMVYAETIANPLLQVCALPDVAAFARRHSLQLVVDNTFATPLLARPLEHGATLSLHSLTKFLNGHSDVIGGAVTGDRDTVEKVRKFSVMFGGTLSPFDAWLTERGLQTFALRFSKQCETAHFLANVLANQAAVRTVYYPGREDDPSHALANHVFHGGYGAMVSFDLHGGYEAANALVRNLSTIRLAPSLGGLHTTLSHPALTSHRAYSQNEREGLGITDGLLRLSVGCEEYEQLESELTQAFEPLNAVIKQQQAH
ncbi:trans-sulfuration enzyme family protein [Alicyclobacillus sp. ALC3]|uniref:trans-sulfuration enzyme family protein n=1 Tax=Alicyclobacillus sp. ALC3 TaxID=2796143 RepID=UPI0023790A78|nr:aminotransferase class I/II-fold pyridoxal phosphate-dependent enzyme [Alicyclobacillus sp. ALC3]WDL97460.1 aminotransferase class I/II-fold pyridoxal phosphate-dependent enzyme [Alicyclobacillus sp. ALC3]